MVISHVFLSAKGEKKALPKPVVLFKKILCSKESNKTQSMNAFATLRDRFFSMGCLFTHVC